MGYCMRCGTLMHDKDVETHVCDPADVPEEGKPIKKGEKKAVQI